MRWYTRLSAADREEISRAVATGASIQAIARQMGRAPSTISRELRRTGHRRLRTRRCHYRALSAQRLAVRLGRRRRRPRTLAMNRRLRAYVVAGLARRWSPEQMAIRLAAEYPDDATMRISHEAIYTYLYVLPRGQLRRELLAALRQRHKIRARHTGAWHLGDRHIVGRKRQRRQAVLAFSVLLAEEGGALRRASLISARLSMALDPQRGLAPRGPVARRAKPKAPPVTSGGACW